MTISPATLDPQLRCVNSAAAVGASDSNLSKDIRWGIQSAGAQSCLQITNEEQGTLSVISDRSDFSANAVSGVSLNQINKVINTNMVHGSLVTTTFSFNTYFNAVGSNGLFNGVVDIPIDITYNETPNNGNCQYDSENVTGMNDHGCSDQIRIEIRDKTLLDDINGNESDILISSIMPGYIELEVDINDIIDVKGGYNYTLITRLSSPHLMYSAYGDDRNNNISTNCQSDPRCFSFLAAEDDGSAGSGLYSFDSSFAILAEVPEPTNLALFSLTLLGLAGFGRRKKN